MVDIRNNSINAVSDFHHGTAVDGLEWFGYDPDAPAPGDDRLSFVQVEDVNFDLPEVVLQELVLEVDPLEYSDSFGTDVYQKTLNTHSQVAEIYNFMSVLLFLHSSALKIQNFLLLICS